MSRITARKRVTRITVATSRSVREDFLAVEEPLEIRVGGSALAITMRTPGNDVDLAAGFLVSEGVIARGEEFLAARYCAGATEEGLNTYNVLDIALEATGYRAVVESAALHDYWSARVLASAGGRPLVPFATLVPNVRAYFPTPADVQALESAPF